MSMKLLTTSVGSLPKPDNLKKARIKVARGEMERFIGTSADTPFEPPMDADLAIDTSQRSIEEAISALSDFILEKLGLRKNPISAPRRLSDSVPE